jgi:hypothetical protein
MSVPMAHFERMYADSEEPWEYRRRWYERRKRALTLAMLPRAGVFDWRAERGAGGAL